MKEFIKFTLASFLAIILAGGIFLLLGVVTIMGIAVSCDHKRKGIGCALLEKVEEWGRCDGAVGVRLVSGASRAEAHAFYRKCGYSGDKQQLNLKKMF